MKIKKIFLLFLFTLLFIGISFASDVSNDTISSVDTIDSVDEVIQSSNTAIKEVDNTLTDKINKEEFKQDNTLKIDTSKTYTVNDFDTLHNTLTSEEYSTITLNINSDITLTDSTKVNKAIKTLNINGNGKTIDGNKSYQFLNISSYTTVTIKDITITNCYSENNGGAIYNKGNLTVTDSIFSNNKATGTKVISGGGAIFNDYANLTVADSTFSNNNVIDDYVYGGAILNYYCFVTVCNSTFCNNTAQAGGAIYNDNCVITVCNSTFCNNPAMVGGALCNDYANLTVSNSIFNNNNASDSGAISNDYCNFTITNCTLNNNIAINFASGAIGNYNTNMIITNSTLNNNKAGSNGSAIFNYDSNLTVCNSTFCNNNATYNGGAIGNSWSNLTVCNSRFCNNTAYAGGAIYNYRGNLTVTNSTLSNNMALFGGGAVCNQGNNTIIKNNVFVANKANMTGKAIINNGKATISNNTNSETSKYNGTIYINGTNVQITDNIFYEELNVFINAMNVLNNKYVLTTKVYNGLSNMNVGRVSYTLDGKWIGSIYVKNGTSWISFKIPYIGNHTIIATYINPNGDSIASDIYTFEKKSNINVLFNTYNVKNGKVIIITAVKDDNGNNITSGRVSYNLDNHWIGSINVKNGSSWINFNYTDSVVTFKATYITDSNVTENIYIKTLNLIELKALASQKASNQNNTQPLKNSSAHIMINSMDLLNGKCVITTKVTDDKYVKMNVGRVSYTLNGKWIGSMNVKNGSSWISFAVLGVGNHTVVATYIDTSGKAITTDTYILEKRPNKFTNGFNLLVNQYNVKDGKVIIVIAVKDDKGNSINKGKILYSLNGVLKEYLNVKNGSSWIIFNYTDTTVKFQAIYRYGGFQNIYTRTLDLNEIASLNRLKNH